MQVDIKRVNWVSPAGLLGLTPVASIGPVHVGLFALEGSSLEAPELQVQLDPLQSLLQRHPVLDIHAERAKVSAIKLSVTASVGPVPGGNQPSAFLSFLNS